MPTELILLSIITFISIINILMVIKIHSKSSSTVELEKNIREEFSSNRQELVNNLSMNRTENSNQFNAFQELMQKQMDSMETSQKKDFETFSNQQRQKFADFEQQQKETSNQISTNLKEIRETSEKKISEATETNRVNAKDMREELQRFIKNTEDKLNAIKENVDSNLQTIQTKNTEQLEKMRETVDEKLHKTLETRLTESFKLVSDKLETVQKGLGEMQTLATGVGDLKKVLSNVKTKGVLGEYQLENILEEILTQTQYEKNINTIPNSNDRVEFAIKMPGKENGESCVYLPIDAKFPTEDYYTLLNAYDEADLGKIQQSKKSLEQKIKKFAKDIRQKYISVPHTTDFGILFLPFEGLYAEVLRLNGLFETLQREEHIIITGPTTIAAFLNSLQIGFRTLAIQKRSSEVWEVLGAVKTEFGKFADVLENTKKKLETAAKEIDKAGVRTRAIERQLRDVQALPQSEGVVEELEEELLEMREDSHEQ